MRRSLYHPLALLLSLICIPGLAQAGFFTHAAGAASKTRIYSGVTAKLSTVNGAAFVTSVSGSIPFSRFLNRKITISDGTNTCVGYVQAVGTGETYTEKCTDVPFNSNASWTKGAGWAVAGGKATATAPCNALIYQAWGTAAGALYKIIRVADSVSAGTHSVRIFSVSIDPQTSAGTFEVYITGTGATAGGIIGSNGLGGVFDSISVGQVDSPDTTGCIIVSSRGGATRNWTSNGGINANAASFTVTISE
ncbi:MAG: hypothetical protein WC241_04105 [Candidatus Paceibacterota bacterium]|jgi:hypothetical protein